MNSFTSTFGSIGGRTIDSIRADFPLLTKPETRDIAYLDNAATSQKPKQVIDAVTSFYESSNANVHRAVHHLAAKATEQYESSRRRLADFIGAESWRSIVFTRGTTESVNLVAHAWGGANIGSGDVILLTEMEHHSNLIPWQLLAERTGAELRFIPFDETGTLDLSQLDGLWSDRVKLVSMIHVSNVFGTVNDVATVARYARERGAAVFVDAAQSVPHRPVDVTELGVDFLAFSGHKMCGPTGTGVLYGREELLDEMPPFMGGGEMITAVWLDRAEWNEIPYKFEAGTPNIAGVVGLGSAVEYLQSLGLEGIQAYEHRLTQYALDQLSTIPGVDLYGPDEQREGVLSFNIDGVHAHDAAQLLDREGVAVRPGHHCANPIMRKLGVPATVRASLYFYSTFEEIDRLVRAIDKTKEFFA